MADEQQNASTAEEQKNADVSEETQQSGEQGGETAEQSQDSGSSQQETDDDVLQKELERERERRQKAEKRLAERAYEKREEKRSTRDEEPSGQSGDDNDAPVTKKDLEEFKNTLTQQQREAQAREIATQMSASETEAELTLEYYASRIQPTGDVKEDIRMAHTLATSKKRERESQEQQRAKQSQDSVETNTASGTKNRPATEPELNDTTRSFVRMAGMTWNAQNQRYEGKATWYDPKSDTSGRLS